MGNIGDPISSGSIPAVGTSGTTYASELNLFLTEVKNRLEAQVPKASLAPGELDLDGEALLNAGYLGLIDLGVAPTTPNNSIQCYDDELYWVSAAGVVKLTDTGVVNVTGVGGITGDYGGVNPAQFRFVDADQEYYAYDDFGTGTWAYLWARGLDLAKDATSTTRIRVKAPASLASSYTLTLPDAPSDTTLLTMDASGNVAPLVSEVVEAILSPAVYTTKSGDNFGSYVWYSLSTISGGNFPQAQIPLPVQVGDVIDTVRVKLSKESDAGTTWTLKVYKVPMFPAAAVQIGVTDSDNTAGSAGLPASVTLEVSGINETVTNSFSYYAEVINNNNAPADIDLLGGTSVILTRLINPL